MTIVIFTRYFYVLTRVRVLFLPLCNNMIVLLYDVFRLPRWKQFAKDEVSSQPGIADQHVPQTNATRDWFSIAAFQR